MTASFYLLIVLNIGSMGNGNSIQSITQFKTSEECEAAASAVRTALNKIYLEQRAAMNVLASNETRVICTV
jgi:hypothetical protein